MPPTSPRGSGSYSVTQVVLELTSKFSCPQLHDDSPASATLVLRSQAGTSTSDYSAAGNQIGLPELLTKWAFDISSSGGHLPCMHYSWKHTVKMSNNKPRK